MSDPAASPATPSPRLQLKHATVLLMDPNPQGISILSQIFAGFGAGGLLRAGSFEDAQEIVRRDHVDLIICDATLVPHEADGFEFVEWLRRSRLEPNALAPFIIVGSHTSRRNVARARDCGAHFVVSKPLSPAVLLDRIVWIAQANRTFVECDAYAGPDRRFQVLGPPDGEGRREGDLSGEVGAAVTPNMSQDEIDNLMQPTKIAV